MNFMPINDPRTKDGGFGDYVCHRCGVKSTAYIKIQNTVLCKGCLLDGVDVIDRTMLQDCIRKGELKKFKSE